MLFTGSDGLQNMFVYQPTFNNINIKQVSNEYDVYAWNPKGIYNFEHKALHDHATVIIYSPYKIVLRSNNSVLTIAQNNYKTKILNTITQIEFILPIIFNSDNWSRCV